MREIFIDNLLVRVHFIIEMCRPALRHGSLNPLFQVALFLLSVLEDDVPYPVGEHARLANTRRAAHQLLEEAVPLKGTIRAAERPLIRPAGVLTLRAATTHRRDELEKD